MAIMNWKCLSFTFSMICIILTIGISIISMYRFSKDEDITLVKVTKFLSSKEAIYPSFSFCIMSPFLEKKFKVYGDDSINMTSYIKFLDGTLWDDRFLRIDYDNVTVSLFDNLLAAKYKTQDNSFINGNSYHYVSFRSSKRKCFTIDAPFDGSELIKNVDIELKEGVLLGGSPTKKIKTYIHYPGQRFTAYYTIGKTFPPWKYNNTNYKMIFRVRNIEVITRRNRIHEPCEEDWRHFDQHIMEGMKNKAGCCPPHWKRNLDLPICSNPNQMKNFDDQPTTSEMESNIQPCRVITRLDYDYTYSEFDINKVE